MEASDAAYFFKFLRVRVYAYNSRVYAGLPERPTATIETPVDFIVIRDDNGTPIVLVQKFPDMGDMQRFAVLTPQHGEDFQKALQMLNLAPVTISKLVIK